MSQLTISPKLEELLFQTIEYAIQKFANNDYFSLLLQAQHEDAVKSFIFKLPTLSESIDAAERQLREKASDTQRYVAVLAHDTPAIVGWVEEGANPSIHIDVPLSYVEEENGKSLYWSGEVKLVKEMELKFLGQRREQL